MCVHYYVFTMTTFYPTTQNKSLPFGHDRKKLIIATSHLSGRASGTVFIPLSDGIMVK